MMSVAERMDLIMRIHEANNRTSISEGIALIKFRELGFSYRYCGEMFGYTHGMASQRLKQIETLLRCGDKEATETLEMFNEIMNQ